MIKIVDDIIQQTSAGNFHIVRGLMILCSLKNRNGIDSLVFNRNEGKKYIMN